jgi:hypothetical protein
MSPINYLSYTIFDKLVEIDQMLDNMSMITSMRSFKNVHSCKFTFNLIVEHVVDKFFVSSVFIICDKLAEFKLNMSDDNHCVPYFSDHKVNNLFNACDIERKILFPCSYRSSKGRDLVQRTSSSSHKFFLSTAKCNEFGRYASKSSKELYKHNYENDKRSMFSSNFEMFNGAMMKLEILNKLCCLQEIVVLPSTKLFAGLQTPTKHFQCEFRKMNLMFLVRPHKVHNSYMSCYHYASMNMDEKESNEGSNLFDHEKCYIYPPSTFYRLILGQQKLRTTFLQGREDDTAQSKTSTNTINIEYSYKVKAILNSKSYYFPLVRLLLGFYDYKLKHIAIFDYNNDHQHD